MDRVIRSNEDLKRRMESFLDPGEVVISCGMGVMGTRTVLVAATDRRLLLEWVTITFRRKELQYIMYDSLEAVEGRKGESSRPAWARINLESAILDRISTSLLLKVPGERVMHIQFKPMPLFRGNGSRGPEIASVVHSQRPHVPRTIDLAAERQSEPGCLARSLRWGAWGAIAGTALGGIAIGRTEGILGLGVSGFLAGGLLALF